MGAWYELHTTEKLQKDLQEAFPAFSIHLKTYTEDVLQINLTAKDDEWDVVAANQLQYVSHLNAIVSGDLYVETKWRGFNIAQKLMKIKQGLGYNLLARVHDHNKAQQHILEKTGWKYLGNNYWFWEYKEQN